MNCPLRPHAESAFAEAARSQAESKHVVFQTLNHPSTLLRMK